jgi:DNA-binding SARP family transcriptional activator/WD40 repeat protein
MSGGAGERMCADGAGEMHSDFQIRVLGALEVAVRDRVVWIGPDVQRRVFAALALCAPEVVSEDRLVDLVWGEESPRTANRTLQKYVYRLRVALADLDGATSPRVETRGHGYALVLGGATLDTLVFADCVQRARANGEVDPSAALSIYDEALALWRGPAWEEFVDHDAFRADAVRLDDLRISVMEERVDLLLTLGRPHEVVGELEALAQAHPLRERVRELLMLALYRSGRQVEALRAYHEFRSLLIEETGLDPSFRLQRLEQDLVAGVPRLDHSRVAPADVDARQSNVVEQLARVLHRAEAANLALEQAHQELAQAALEHGVRPMSTTVGFTDLCPYKGLAPFESSDAAFFCGRDALVATLVARVATSSFVAVVGASGAGKSSLVRAGLLPALARGAVAGSETWQTVVLTPSDATVDVVAQAMTAVADGECTAPRLVVIDQFEELLVAGADGDTRDDTMAALTQAAGDRRAELKIVIVLRADYYEACAHYPELAPLVSRAQVLVGPLTERELRTAIAQPAARADLVIEPALVDAVCDEAKAEPGALPLVSTAMFETWTRRRGRTLPLSAYVDAGGVRGAVARMADATYDSFDAQRKAIANAMLLRLADTGEGRTDVRRRAPLRELAALDQGSGVLEALVEARLVTIDAEYGQVAHEALLREWPRLRSLLDADRDGRDAHRRLTDAAARWHDDERDASHLYRGASLNTVAEWRVDGSRELTPTEAAFVDASVGARADELRVARRTVRRTRTMLSVLAIVLVAALVGATVSVVQWRRATTASQQARVAALNAELGRLTQLAGSLPSDRVDLALLLAVEAHRLRPGDETEGALEQALHRISPGLDQVIGSTEGNYPDVSSDGRSLVEPDGNGTAHIVDIQSGTVRATTGPLRGPFLPRFNSQGTEFVIGGSGDTNSAVTVWRTDDGAQVGAPIAPGGDGAYAMWDPASPSGLYVLSDTGSIERWDRRDVDHPVRVGDAFVLPPPSPDIPLIAHVSADGRLLAASANAYQDDAVTTVWDASTHAVLQQLSGTVAGFEADNGTVILTTPTQVMFRDATTADQRSPAIGGFTSAGAAVVSADATRIAISDDHARIDVIDLPSGRSEVTLATTAFPNAFLPDGRLVASDQSHAALWNVEARRGPLITTLGGLPDEKIQARYTSDGSRIWALGLDDSRSTFWDVASGAQVYDRLAPDLDIADVDRGGRLAAVVLPDASIALVDLASGETRSTFEGGTRDESAQFSPTGTTVAVAGNGQGDQRVQLWDVSDPRSPRRQSTLEVPGLPSAELPSSLSLWFAPDGDILVGDQRLATLSMFDPSSGAMRWTHPVGGAFLEGTFSPDGSTFTVVSLVGGETSVRSFATRDGAERPGFQVVQAVGVAYSRDGRFIVTTGVLLGDQGGVRLWDATTLAPIGASLEVPGSVATFDDSSPDGDQLASGTDHGVITLLDVDLAHWEERACAVAGRNLTKQEWAEYLPDQAYRMTCSAWPSGA